MFESMPDHRKIVWLMFLLRSAVDLLNECGFLKNDINHVCMEFEKVLIEQNEDYLDYIKGQEEPIIDRIPNK